MREVFAPREPTDPGRVFYTITAADVHKTVIQTEIGPVNVVSFMGPVQKGDVGKRLYRVPNEAGDYWFWQVENNEQRDKRLGKARLLARIHKAEPCENDDSHCTVCGQPIRSVPGGHGPTWVHADSGAVAAPNPAQS